MASIETNNDPIREEVDVKVAPSSAQASKHDDDEFDIVIRKLERDVRPRGVLADG